MQTVEVCARCGYAIPTDAPSCPGCARRGRTAAPRPTAGAGLPGRSVHPVPGIRAVREPPASFVPDLRPERGAPYRSLLRPALQVRALCGITGWLAMGFALGQATAFLAELDRVAVKLPAWLPERISDVTRVVGWAGLVAMALTLVAFVAWSVRGYRNLPALGIRDRRLWTAWAVVGWLIPGANLVVPKMVVDDLWRASSPSLAPLPGRAWRRRPVGDVVHRWWALWLAVPAVAVLGANLLNDRIGPLDAEQAMSIANLAAALLLIGALQAAHDLVGIITVAQARRADLLAGDLARARAVGDDLADYLR